MTNYNYSQYYIEWKNIKDIIAFQIYLINQNIAKYLETKDLNWLKFTTDNIKNLQESHKTEEKIYNKILQTYGNNLV